MRNIGKKMMVILLFICLAALFASAVQASIRGQVEVVVAFSPPNELPEGIAIDKEGNMYVSLGPPFFVGGSYGEIRKISPDGTQTTLVQYPGGPAPAGLAVDATGTLYYALGAVGDPMVGVYRLKPGGDPVRLAGTENILLPNGLALDKQGNLYVSDSLLGAIWRIPRGRAAAQIWIQHDLITGCVPDAPVGANGVAHWRGNLLVANTAKGLLVSIPIQVDGTAGTPEIVAGTDECDPPFDDLDSMDGIALDVEGNVYALMVISNKFARINPEDGSYTLLLTEADGLDNPASITFGTGRTTDRKSVYFTNYAVFGSPNSLGPAILKLDVGVPGLPLP